MNNPIRQIIPDDVFQTLQQYNLLNEKVLRDIEIKRRYITLHRQHGVPSAEAIEQILAEHPYLQFDTVRKIIYSIKLPEERPRMRAMPAY